MQRYSKSRARQVCIRCHERKVRCDLQKQPSQRCSNCQHFGSDCRRHIGIRKRQKFRHGHVGPKNVSTPTQCEQIVERSPSPHPDVIDCRHQSSTESSQQEVLPQSLTTSYSMAESTGNHANQRASPFVHCARVVGSENQALREIPGLHQRLLDDSGLSNVLERGLIDLYIQQLFPLVPIVDKCHLDGPDASTLVRYSVFLAGSMMRQPYSGGLTSKGLFLRLKNRLFMENQQETPFATLQSLSILSCWSCHNPTAATLDSPWHWIGSATKLAIQLQLHSEANYTSMNQAGCARRLWWYLKINDILQALCYSREPSLRHLDCDVQLPGPDDFDEQNLEAVAFCQLSKLSLLLSEIEAAYDSKKAIEPDELQNLLISLKCWLQSLPGDIRLFDEGPNRKMYNRVINEVHIVFCVAVILVYLLPGSHRQNLRFCLASMTASSCIENLYGEILHHAEVCRLIPIHAWFILFSYVPKCYCGPILALHGHSSQPASTGDMDMAKAVLVEMAKAYPSAEWVLDKISKIWQGLPEILDPSGPGGRAAAANDTAQSPLTSSSVMLDFDFSELFPPPNTWWPGVNTLNINIQSRQEHEDTGDGNFEYSTPALDFDWNTLWQDFGNVAWGETSIS